MLTLEQLKNIIYSDFQIKSFIGRPKENCYNCALRLAKLLEENRIQCKTIGLLYWVGLSEAMPLNHFVIACQVQAKNIVIDPTITQFGESQPFLGEMSSWLDKIKQRLPFKVIKVKEFNSPQQASLEIGVTVTLGMSPLDFDGKIIQSTVWYEKVLKNPDLYRIQQEKLMNPKKF